MRARRTLAAANLTSQTVALAVTVWTTAVERFVLSSPGIRVGDKCEQTKRSTAVVRTVTTSVTVWLRETMRQPCFSQDDYYNYCLRAALFLDSELVLYCLRAVPLLGSGLILYCLRAVLLLRSGLILYMYCLRAVLLLRSGLVLYCLRAAHFLGSE